MRFYWSDNLTLSKVANCLMLCKSVMAEESRKDWDFEHFYNIIEFSFKKNMLLLHMEFSCCCWMTVTMISLGYHWSQNILFQVKQCKSVLLNTICWELENHPCLSLFSCYGVYHFGCEFTFTCLDSLVSIKVINTTTTHPQKLIWLGNNKDKRMITSCPLIKRSKISHSGTVTQVWRHTNRSIKFKLRFWTMSGTFSWKSGTPCLCWNLVPTWYRNSAVRHEIQ